MAVVAFYLFALLTLFSGAMVITRKNPVHAVLFLILAFFNAAGLMVLLGAEFVAMLLVIVYVGAVAVLFLFVVMMLDVNFEELRRGFVSYLPIGAVIGMVLVGELIFVFSGWSEIVPAIAQTDLPMTTGEGAPSNTAALGQVIYTDYLLAFQGAGLILLVAMIGAIVLTLRQRAGVRRQSIGKQFATRSEEVMAVRKVEPGQGAQ